MQIDTKQIIAGMDALGGTMGENNPMRQAESKRGPGRPRTAHLRPGPKDKKWELTQLQAVHHEILRLKLTGMKNTEIALALRVTPAMVNYTVSSSLGSQKLALMQAARDCDSIDFGKRMQELLPDIAGLYETTVRDENADLKLRIQVATTVAKDFAGQAVPAKIQATHIHAHLTTEQIEDIKRQGMDNARAAGMIVESPEDIAEEALAMPMPIDAEFEDVD